MINSIQKSVFLALSLCLTQLASVEAVVPCGVFYNDESMDISLARILTEVTEGILKDDAQRLQCTVNEGRAVIEYRGIWGSDLLVESYYVNQYDDDWSTPTDPYHYRLSVSNGVDGYSSTNQEEYEACQDMIALACRTLDAIEGSLRAAAASFPH